MKIRLKRFSEERYSDLLNNFIENINFYTNPTYNTIKIDGEDYTIDELSEDISFNPIEIELSDNLFHMGAKANWLQNYEVGMALKQQLSNYEDKYSGVFYEPYFWAYICHLPQFKEYIIRRFINNKQANSKSSIDSLIPRYYFAKGQISRTGIMFYYLFTDCLYDNKKQYSLSKTAFEYIDITKAIYERDFRKNKDIVKAFVEGIIINDRSPYFKNPKYRTVIPTHISNLAAINSLDTYFYSDLIKKIAYEQKKIINLNLKNTSINVSEIESDEEEI